VEVTVVGTVDVGVGTVEVTVVGTVRLLTHCMFTRTIATKSANTTPCFRLPRLAIPTSATRILSNMPTTIV